MKGIDKEVVAEAYRGMPDIVKRGAVADYFPVFATEGGDRWLGEILCKDCKMEYRKGHDPDCKIGHMEGVGRLY